MSLCDAGSPAKPERSAEADRSGTRNSITSAVTGRGSTRRRSEMRFHDSAIELMKVLHPVLER